MPPVQYVEPSFARDLMALMRTGANAPLRSGSLRLMAAPGFGAGHGPIGHAVDTFAVLGTIFVCLSIALAAIAGVSRQPAEIDTTLANQLNRARMVPGRHRTWCGRSTRTNHSTNS